MVNNFRFDAMAFRKHEMGEAMFHPWKKRVTESAEEYDRFVEENSPDVLVVQGFPDRETLEKRLGGLISNIYYFSGQGELDADILVPEQEFNWESEVLSELSAEFDLGIETSENYLERDNLAIARDDVKAAHNYADDGDTVVHHTSDARAAAAHAAYSDIFDDRERYTVFGFGEDSNFQKWRQFFNGVMQSEMPGLVRKYRQATGTLRPATR